MSSDIPNAFIQAELNRNGKERIIMKITGVLVDILIKVAPNEYAGSVVMEKGQKVIYVEILRAIYGMLESALVQKVSERLGKHWVCVQPVQRMHREPNG